MSDEYNVNLLVKQTKLIAKDINKHNEKYSGFKDLLKDNIPESLADYNGNAYDISSVFHDTNWSTMIKRNQKIKPKILPTRIQCKFRIIQECQIGSPRRRLGNYP